MTVSTLKEHCKSLTYPLGGSKDDLIERLMGDAGSLACQKNARLFKHIAYANAKRQRFN